MRIMTIVLASASVTALAVACVSGCRQPRAAAARRPDAPAIEAAARPATKPDRGCLGMVLAPETVDLTSQLDARVEKIVVRAGDRVERGDVIAVLDTRSARGELAIARAELTVATTERDRARLELAQADERLGRRERTIELPGDRTVAPVSLEEISTARYQQQSAAVKLQAAEAALGSRRAHLEQVETLVAEGAIRAPFAGTIALRYVDAGALLTRGAPLVRLLAHGDLRVRFLITEDVLGRFAVGRRVAIEARGSARYDGAVEHVNSEVDAAARMVFAEASLLIPAGVPAPLSGDVVRVHPR